MTFPPYLAAIPCELSGSVFSGECVFRVDLTDRTQYESASPRHFCWNQDRQVIADDAPLTNHWLPGFVAVKVIDLRNGVAAVEVPDGEVIDVPYPAIQSRPTEISPPRSAVPA